MNVELVRESMRRTVNYRIRKIFKAVKTQRLSERASVIDDVNERMVNGSTKRQQLTGGYYCRKT